MERITVSAESTQTLDRRVQAALAGLDTETVVSTSRCSVWVRASQPPTQVCVIWFERPALAG